MSYSSLMPTNKDKWSPQRSRGRLKFPQGATDTINRGGRSQPMVACHDIPTVKTQVPSKNNQRVDWEHGNRRPSGATSDMTDIPVKHPVHQNPRQDRGRSTERTTEKRGSSVRSSSCEVAYSSRDDTKTPSLRGPLDDVFKALKDGGLRSKLSGYVDSYEKLKAERDYLNSQVSLYKLKLTTAKDLDERLSNLMGSNERYLENVSEKIRPSTLVERFKALESTEWLKAKEAMDKRFGEDDQTSFQLLCSTLTVAFQFAREQIQELYHHQNDILRGCIHSEESVITKVIVLDCYCINRFQSFIECLKQCTVYTGFLNATMM
ncbi:Hypp2792 [Branchiostoma lanceolatum]|uniref:Hypp2792 protein n=1 Tax=Branchiostoma lanceolatum TaxID=7740 RepID=A0A8K0ERP7_BRALA|nr:Hypp2792 [Branchiostoma lanceolatum]